MIFVICELVASQCISRPGCCTTNLNMRSRPMLQVCQKVDVNESEEASILADLCWYSWPIDQGSSGCALNYMLILLLLI